MTVKFEPVSFTVEPITLHYTDHHINVHAHKWREMDPLQRASGDGIQAQHDSSKNHRLAMFCDSPVWIEHTEIMPTCKLLSLSFEPLFDQELKEL